MPRIVSLIASATEIVCALGFEEQLVGRSHECDFPESVTRLPVCTEPKFNVEGTSYQIDQRVKAILQEGLSVYRVHADTLRELRPDVIVTRTSGTASGRSPRRSMSPQEATRWSIDSRGGCARSRNGRLGWGHRRRSPVSSGSSR